MLSRVGCHWMRRGLRHCQAPRKPMSGRRMGMTLVRFRLSLPWGECEKVGNAHFVPLAATTLNARLNAWPCADCIRFRTFSWVLLPAFHVSPLCTYIHTCIHAYMHIYIQTYTRAYMHTCIHAYMHTCMHTYQTAEVGAESKCSCARDFQGIPLRSRPQEFP